MTVKIIGLAKLNAKLARIPDATQKEIRVALAAAADRIVNDMKALVPSDTGALRDSIGWTFGKAPRGALTLGSLFRASQAGQLTATIYAGSDVAYYARWVEFGTTENDPQPYFFVAYRANRKAVKRDVSKAVRLAAAKQVAK